MIAAQCLAACLAGLVLLFARGLGISIPGWTLPFVLTLAIAWPLIWLRELVVRRGESLLRQLPFLIDLLAMSVESGLPLAAALPQAVERLPAGALRDECRRLMRDVKAGMPRDEALRTLAARLELAAVTQFTLAVSAAQRDGGTIVQTLRGQAEQQRNDRFTRAEYRAAQAPVRVLFPLVVFIFPGTLAVVLYPVISRMFSEVARWQ
jgi:tight adherence protein C